MQPERDHAQECAHAIEREALTLSFRSAFMLWQQASNACPAILKTHEFKRFADHCRHAPGAHTVTNHGDFD